MYQRKKGFTLLELLVVISIVGILMAIGVVAFSTAQKKSRDAKRIGDMKSFQSGFEQYYAEHSSSYAACDTMTADTDIFPGGASEDPKNVSPYQYACTASTSTYCVCAALETGGGNATANDCTGLGNTSDGDFYCLNNLQ